MNGDLTRKLMPHVAARERSDPNLHLMLRTERISWRRSGRFGELSGVGLTKDPNGPPWHIYNAVLMSDEYRELRESFQGIIL